MMGLFESRTILHNLLLDYVNDISRKLMVELEEGHFLTNIYTGGGDTYTNEN